MHSRQARAAFAAIFALASTIEFAEAGILRWDTQEVIPGTEGLEPGPGVQLASYQAKYLRGVALGANSFVGWDLSGQFLGAADLGDLTGSDLRGADARGAVVRKLPTTKIDNFIHPDGSIDGLALAEDQVFVIRDHDGGRAVTTWGPPPPVQVKVRRSATFSSASVTRFVFETDAWNSTVSFEPGISVQLGGTLELTFADGVDVVSQVGRTLDVFDWTGVTPSGSFGIQRPYAWDLSKLYTTGDVTLLAVAEPAAAPTLVLGFLALGGRRRLTCSQPRTWKARK